MSGLACHDCGLPYGDPAWIEAVVSDHVWNNHLSPSGDEGGILCICCMAKRAVAAGLPPVPVKLTAGPFSSGTSLKPQGRRGKYRGTGDGSFVVNCFTCFAEARFKWGTGGPACAPRELRKNRWQMTGRTVNARWYCPKCASDSGSRSESRDAFAARAEGRQSGGEAVSPTPSAPSRPDTLGDEG